MLSPITEAGRSALFLLRMLAGLRPGPALLRNVLQQTFLIGARSLVIIMVCGFFVGMVLALQSINALQQFGASDQVSLLVGKSLFRELGPVLTALLFAGRAGTSIAAEIGLFLIRILVVLASPPQSSKTSCCRPRGFSARYC